MQSFFSQPAKARSPSVERLSDRELEIFQLLGQGMGTRQIADRLGRSVKTIETHRARIMQKLAVKSAAQLVCYASRWVETDRHAMNPR